MAYLNSSDVYVFPTTRRETGRRFTELNVTSLVDAFVDKEGFIVPDSDFKFVIKGYLFSSTKSAITSLFSASDSNIWAHIKIATTLTFPEISGQDNGTQYEGLYLANAKDSTYTYALKLFEKDTSGNWIVCEDSMIKFNTESTDKVVDGGEVS